MGVTLDYAHVWHLVQAAPGHRKQVVYTPAQRRSRISKPIQDIAIDVHSPQQRREVVHLCLQAQLRVTVMHIGLYANQTVMPTNDVQRRKHSSLVSSICQHGTETPGKVTQADIT